MPVRVGILADPFDPVCLSHVDSCRAALSSGLADQAVLVLSGSGSGAVSADDRWRMLCAAAACSRQLIPLRLPPKADPGDPDRVLRFVRKKVPDANPFFLPPAVPGERCPSVEEYCALKELYSAIPRLSGAGPWVDQLFEALNPHRFAHSLAVARTSVDLALRYGIDPVKAEEAGLLHDCAKCLPLSDMQKIVKKHGMTDDPDLLASAALLHSLAGACVARDAYGVRDQEILDAIAYHNTGHEGMSPLAMCVCLADFIEPNRDPFPLLEDVRRLSEISLEKALLLSLEGVAAHVSSKGKKLHPRTLNTIAWLKAEF